MADLVITRENVGLVSGNTDRKVATVAITQGQTIDLNSNDQAVLATTKVRGIAVTNAALGEQVVFALPGAVVAIGATLAVGKTYWQSGNPGMIDNVEPTTGTTVTVIGVASTTGNLKFNPNNSGVVVP